MEFGGFLLSAAVSSAFPLEDTVQERRSSPNPDPALHRLLLGHLLAPQAGLACLPIEKRICRPPPTKNNACSEVSPPKPILIKYPFFIQRARRRGDIGEGVNGREHPRRIKYPGFLRGCSRRVARSNENVRHDVVDHGSERFDFLDVANNRDPFVVIAAVIAPPVARGGCIATVVVAVGTTVVPPSRSRRPRGGDFREGLAQPTRPPPSFHRRDVRVHVEPAPGASIEAGHGHVPSALAAGEQPQRYAIETRIASQEQALQTRAAIPPEDRRPVLPHAIRVQVVSQCEQGVSVPFARRDMARLTEDQRRQGVVPDPRVHVQDRFVRPYARGAEPLLFGDVPPTEHDARQVVGLAYPVLRHRDPAGGGDARRRWHVTEIAATTAIPRFFAVLSLRNRPQYSMAALANSAFGIDVPPAHDSRAFVIGGDLFPQERLHFEKKGVGHSLVIAAVMVVVIIFPTEGHDIDEELAELVMTFVLIRLAIRLAFSLLVGVAAVFAAAVLVDEERPTRDDHGAVVPNDLQLPRTGPIAQSSG